MRRIKLQNAIQLAVISRNFPKIFGHFTINLQKDTMRYIKYINQEHCDQVKLTVALRDKKELCLSVAIRNNDGGRMHLIFLPSKKYKARKRNKRASACRFQQTSV